MSHGYIYCFSNPSMPGILKVGMTERTPEIRLGEANARKTWLPTPYKIEFAKKVLNPKQKEKTLHTLLEQYTDRINPHEFFRVSPEEVRVFFDLMDGEMLAETCKEEEDGEEVDEEDTSSESAPRMSSDMSKCFTNGQHIRHKFGINKIWIGIYDSSQNGIIYDTKFYKSLSGFAKAHFSKDGKPQSVSGWLKCECEVNGKWLKCMEVRH